MNAQVSKTSTSSKGSHANRSSTPSSLNRPAPFNDDPEAVETRANCDYSIKITTEMATSGKAPRPVRVFADGIYDLFHGGHARLLMQAKNVFPQVYLLAGVNSDYITHKNKGQTVMTEDERYEVVRHCRYVDEVVKDVPWILDDTFLEANKIDFVAHDDIPYTLGSSHDIYKHLKDKRVFVATERTVGVCTTDLVARIIKDYDKYVYRNLSRGYTGREMNISMFNEKKILLQNLVAKTKEKFEEIYYSCVEKSRKIINDILDLFGTKGILGALWKKRLQDNNTKSD